MLFRSPAGATYRITVTYDDGPPQVTLDGNVRLDGRVPLLAGEGVREVNVRVPNIPSQSALPHGGAEVGTIRHVDSGGVISATGAPR